MNDLGPIARLFLLVVMPLLAGVGLCTILDSLTPVAETLAIAGLALGLMAWLIREFVWVRRVRRDIERDIAFYEIFAQEDE